MRIFVAIDIPVKILNKIKEIQNKLHNFEGKKTEQENLHLTLKFLGHISKDEIEEVKKRLRRIKLKGFEAEIDSLGVFDPDSIRIIWLHMTNCEELQREVDEALSGLFEKEKRFMSHLTIARVKNVKEINKFFLGLRKIKFDKIKFKVKNFNLKNSVLSRKGSVYENLEEYDLLQ